MKNFPMFGNIDGDVERISIVDGLVVMDVDGRFDNVVVGEQDAFSVGYEDGLLVVS